MVVVKFMFNLADRRLCGIGLVVPETRALPVYDSSMPCTRLDKAMHSPCQSTSTILRSQAMIAVLLVCQIAMITSDHYHQH